MVLQFYGIATSTINLFRGQQSRVQFNPVDNEGSPISAAGTDTADMCITTTLSPDSASVIHTFTDLVIFAGLVRKDFSVADVALLPLGSFLFECRLDNGTDPPQVVMQGQINIYPTQQG